MTDLGTRTAVAPTAANLPLAIHGGGELLRSMLIADDDGSYKLALWLAAPLETPTTQTILPDTNGSVSLDLAGNWGAAAQQPSRDNTTAALGSGSHFAVPVNGAVTVVTLTPVAAATSSADGSPAVAEGSRSNYLATQQSDGAVLTSSLDPATTPWSGSPSEDASAPAGAGVGAAVSATDQLVHLDVPGAPTTWTIEAWEHTDNDSGSFATFVHGTGMQGTQLRTYDVTDDPGSHEQLSGYGLPTSGSYGNEVVGQALLTTWHYVALTDDGQLATLYVDGLPVSTAPTSPGPLKALDIGAVSSSFRGSVTGLGVYASALTPIQVLAHAIAADAPCTCSQLPISLPAVNPVTLSNPVVTRTPDSPVSLIPMTLPYAPGPTGGAPLSSAAGSAIFVAASVQTAAKVQLLDCPCVTLTRKSTKPKVRPTLRTLKRKPAAKGCRAQEK